MSKKKQTAKDLAAKTGKNEVVDPIVNKENTTEVITSTAEQSGEAPTEIKNDSKVTDALAGLTLPKGRPVNENSARQKRIREMEAKRAAGELHRGRPINPDSARQQKLNGASNGESKTGAPKGRPVNPDSARQKQIAERNEKLKAWAAKLEADKAAATKETTGTADATDVTTQS